MAIGEEGNFWLGIAACAGAVFFFGSMFVPVKRYNCGDGMFVQFIMGIAIFLIGIIVYLSRGLPSFYPLPLLGGFFWAVANSTAIPLVETMGMALALLTWKTTSCLMGWATARFGLFGVIPSPPKSDALNYAGLALLCAGGIVFLFVHKAEGRPKVKMTMEGSEIFASSIVVEDKKAPEELKTIFGAIKTYVTKYKRFIAMFMCLFNGVLYGSRTTPVIYMQDHYEMFPNASPSGVDYVFSYAVGTIATTTVIFLIYTVIMRGHPVMRTALIVPSIASGIVWAIGTVLLFVSNDNLSQTIAYPIVTVLPGAVAALWSVLYFREIKGVRDISMMLVAMSLTLSGSALIAISKKVSV